MSHSPQPSSSSRNRFSSGLIITLGGIAIAIAFIWQATGRDSAQWSVFLTFALTHLRGALLVALVPGLALLWGYSILRPLQSRLEPAERTSLALSLALGWGLVSLFVWLMAAVGSTSHLNLFKPFAAFAVVALSAILLIRQLISLKNEVIGRLSAAINSLPPSATHPFSLLGAASLFIVLMFVITPLFFTALTPSFFYDVLEYHLPDAAHVIATGSLSPIPGNAYSAMPQGVEMLFAFGRLLEGGVTDFAPKLVHFYLGLSVVLLLLALLREFGIPLLLRLFAAIVFLCHPISFKLLMDAYIDMGPALFATAAILCFLRSCRAAKKGNLYLPLAALFTGLALSCKYPALGMVVAPFLLILAPMALFQRDKSVPIPRFLITLISLGVLVVAAYSPWLIRALVYEHTPFPPLTQAWFASQADPGHAAIRAFMSQAHRPELPVTPAYWSSALHRIPVPGTLLVIGALFALLAPRSDRRRRALGAFALFGYLVWCTPPRRSRSFSRRASSSLGRAGSFDDPRPGSTHPPLASPPRHIIIRPPTGGMGGPPDRRPGNSDNPLRPHGVGAGRNATRGFSGEKSRRDGPVF